MILGRPVSAADIGRFRTARCGQPTTTGQIRRKRVARHCLPCLVDQFERSGLVFPVQDHGPADGAAVVLLHGFPQDASSYDHVVPQLTEQGFRVLVPTQRGYAASARPTRRRDYHLREMVGDVVALLDAAGLERAHLVGHDWGGAVAWGVAGWRPARLHSLTVLSTPHPAAMAESLVRSTQALKSWYMAVFQLPWLPEQLLPRVLGKSLSNSGLPADQASRYTAAMADPAALTAALNWYRGMQIGALRRAPDVTVPTTFVWGDHDFALGRDAAERTAAHVTADYTFEPLRAGHWLPETRPDQVAAAIVDRARRAA